MAGIILPLKTFYRVRINAFRVKRVLTMICRVIILDHFRVCLIDLYRGDIEGELGFCLVTKS